jgi:endonuclease/exonuclease/phosphatase family metal-dependent hydrolase
VTARSVRVATWNVHGLRAGVDVVAAAIEAEAPDVLLLQESGPRRRLRALGAALDMGVAADPPSFPRRRVTNAILSGAGRTISSPRLVRFARDSILHPRGALIVTVDGTTFVSVHLGLAGPERGRHARELLTVLERWAGPVVVGGDLNARPEDGAPSTIADRFPDVWPSVGEGAGATFPSTAPTSRIDYVFAGPAVQALRAWTAGGEASDHLMVVADLTIER